MAVLGIITCEILELEMASLVGGDSDISRITVIDERPARSMIEAIGESGASHVTPIPHISAFRPQGEGDEVLVKVLEVGLHRKKEVLQRRLAEETKKIGPYVDLLFLGYGQCGGALTSPDDVVDVSCPLEFLRDTDGPVADCVGLCLGGNRAYDRKRKEAAGTYYMTAGWSSHWRDMFGSRRDDHSVLDPVMLARMMRGYRRVLVVHSPVIERELLLRRAEEFSSLAGLKIEECEGSLELLRKCYYTAKRGLFEKARQENR